MQHLLIYFMDEEVQAWLRLDARDCLGRSGLNCGGGGRVASVRATSLARLKGPRARSTMSWRSVEASRREPGGAARSRWCLMSAKRFRAGLRRVDRFAASPLGWGALRQQ